MIKTDIRLPVGAMFAILGALLAGYGVLHAGEPAMRPMGVPITLIWGAVMLVFGLLMLWGARRARARRGPTGHGPVL
jgi:hypothetical protein